jgi:chromosome segregation ATPase
MKLKQVEIYGFKSFAQRTQLALTGESQVLSVQTDQVKAI